MLTVSLQVAIGWTQLFSPTEQSNDSARRMQWAPMNYIKASVGSLEGDVGIMDHTEVQIRIRGLFKPLRPNPLPFMGGDIPGFAQLQPRDKGMPHRAELPSSLPQRRRAG